MAKKKLTPSITDAGADSPFGEVLVTPAREAWDRYYGVTTAPQPTPAAEAAPAPAAPAPAAPAKKRPASPPPAPAAGFSLATPTPPGNTFDAFEAASRNAAHPGRGGEALSYGEAQRKANAEAPAVASAASAASPMLGANLSVKEEARYAARPGDSRKVIDELEAEIIRLKKGLPKGRTLKDDYAGSNAGQADVEAELRGFMDRGYDGK